MTGAYHDSFAERLDEQYAAPRLRRRHPCARPGCTSHVPVDKLACHQDWQQLPPDIRNAVLRAWHDGGADQRAVQTAKYQAARKRAISYWERSRG